MKKIAIIFHRIGPYHFARARATAKVIDTTLIEAFKSDDTYQWDLVTGADGFVRTTVFEKSPESKDELVRGIQTALDACRPDAVAVPGWGDALAFAAIQWCAANGVPAIVMSETTEWDEPRRPVKEWVKRRILKLCTAGLAGGQPHADYLVMLGMSPATIFQGYDAVDNEYFAQKAGEARAQGVELRKKFGLPENYFLASARFVEKKNLPNLVRAYAQYRNQAEKAKRPKSEIWDLVLLGDGHLKPELTSLITGLGLQESVLLPGFKQYGELPAYYALAKAFIHASTIEQWGLVVNEAMASGLPVLVSHRCGCAHDLVQENVNGFTFDPFNTEQIAGIMFRVSGSTFPIASLGAASTRIIANWSPDRFAQGLGQATDAALAAPRVGLGMLDRLLLQLLSRR
ncbi:MAG TPA: glycosyltransferase [Pseudomonadales bacterium]|nr:glycosyltransferase [Pseudomonadales bacterium]